ncbi:hypothetical protein DAC17_117 [Bacteroides phage DAC17]|nr:hypothetical protein DAC17_117 [Bacteroides phage DAC17]
MISSNASISIIIGFKVKYQLLDNLLPSGVAGIGSSLLTNTTLLIESKKVTLLCKRSQSFMGEG